MIFYEGAEILYKVKTVIYVRVTMFVYTKLWISIIVLFIYIDCLLTAYMFFATIVYY